MTARAPDSPRRDLAETRIDPPDPAAETSMALDAPEDLPSGAAAPAPPAPAGPDESLEARIKRRLASHDDATSQDTREDLLIGRVINQRFEVVSKIGAGGMGAVYRARQIGMQRDVAIKVLLRELTDNEVVLRRFHLEALAVSKLRHPNTIQIFDFGETEDGLLYIAMELLEGRPLLKVLSDDHQLSVKRALHVLQQTAKSLREAHGKGIVHRDLKPDNIFLQSMGEDQDFVKVLDFGVAKVAEGDGQNKTLTKAGSIFGTPKYMSPEQSRGGDIDARSDLYALGVILYELLTGRVPFNAENPLGILIKHLQEVPPPFGLVRPDLIIPEAVERFTLKLLAKSADARPQTAEAVIREAERLEAELPPIFRAVVTREAAAAAGIEIATLSVTAHDTAILGADGLTEVSVATGEPAAPRRRWLGGALGGAAVLAAGGVGLFAALPALPPAYVDFVRLEGVNAGEVPEFDLQSVYVQLVSEPAGADVVDAAGQVLGQTPHVLRRPRNAPEVRLTFRKAGHLAYGRAIAFAEDAKVSVVLDPIVPEPARVDPAQANPSRTEATAAPAATTPTSGSPTAASEPPPARTPPSGPRKVDETKANPYGAGRPAPEPAKANPYQ